MDILKLMGISSPPKKKSTLAGRVKKLATKVKKKEKIDALKKAEQTLRTKLSKF